VDNFQKRPSYQQANEATGALERRICAGALQPSESRRIILIVNENQESKSLFQRAEPIVGLGLLIVLFVPSCATSYSLLRIGCYLYLNDLRQTSVYCLGGHRGALDEIVLASGLILDLILTFLAFRLITSRLANKHWYLLAAVASLAFVCKIGGMYE
jgi:hypothetical protein